MRNIWQKSPIFTTFKPANYNKLMNYKLKELKTYGALESLYQGARRYRTVSDEMDTSYMNVEFSFYNLRFDQQAWTANITLRAVEHYTNREICKLDKAVTVNPDQNVMTIRDGWGTPQPGFWKKGTYKWEVYIDNGLVGETYFYITQVGKVTPTFNPFFDITQIRLFEGPYDGVAPEQRVYLQAFDGSKSRYINVELSLKNKQTGLDNLPLEFHFYVYNEQQYLKAYMTHFMHINDRRASIVLETGYGMRDVGFWEKGNYTLHIVFMDCIVGSILFNVSDQNVPFSGTWQTTLPAISENNAVSTRHSAQKYKLKEIKSYGSLETLYQGNRKYRVVFDEAEICYVNVEASFYNLLFSEADWDATVLLRVVNYHTYTEVCRLEKKITITQDQNIVFVRDGWGTPEPGFWKQNTYRWEISIDGKILGESYFYIVNHGLVNDEQNPYFDLTSIKLYEGPHEGIPFGQRRYLEKFNYATTRYLNVELTLENKLTHVNSVPLEFQINIYNDSHQLKAFMVLFKHIENKADEIVIETGYGTPEPGFWFKDYYSAEVLFMDHIIAVIPFEVGDEDVVFDGEYDLSHDTWAIEEVETNKQLTYDEAKAELDELIGLEAVKKQIEDLSTYLKYQQLAAQRGIKAKEQFNLHSVFTGNPGTGKTTVARMLGNIYRALGVLSNGKVYEVGRAELVAEYIGQTAPKVKKAIDQARGGILFIDEAYSLSNRGDDEKDFGREVIEVLIKEMSDGKGDIAIVCAGYTKEMENFMKMNPGLSSRFGSVIAFPDYTPDELMLIADYTSNKKGVTLAAEAREAIYFEVVESYRNRNRNFGNARFIGSLIEEGRKNMALRLMVNPNPNEISAEEFITITQTDIEKIFARKRPKGVKLPIDEALLHESLAKLNALMGLDNIKAEVNEQVKLVRYYLEIGKDVHTAFSTHTVFSGNPGTGKTTVARILAQIYKALGILERGHLVECDRRSLVAGYVGQTAIKTGETIDSAMGGCLFIDEAYALTAGGSGDYGREAVETILKRMEDDRGKFTVIVAGYTKEMQHFLESNPGLKSRFDKHFYFKDYSESELLQIAVDLFAEKGLSLDAEAQTFLQQHLGSLLRNRTKYFGNGRAVRKIVDETLRQHDLHLAGMHANQRSPEVVNTITFDDLLHLRNARTSTEDDKRLGFQL
jgi:SpoVK/Ycf46/Vps4 family AAA+-type ATPase